MKIIKTAGVSVALASALALGLGACNDGTSTATSAAAEQPQVTSPPTTTAEPFDDSAKLLAEAKSQMRLVPAVPAVPAPALEAAPAPVPESAPVAKPKAAPKPAPNVTPKTDICDQIRDRSYKSSGEKQNDFYKNGCFNQPAPKAAPQRVAPVPGSQLPPGAPPMDWDGCKPPSYGPPEIACK